MESEAIKRFNKLIEEGNIDKARELYEKEVFKDVVKCFCSVDRKKFRLSERVFALILSVGLNWPPIALSILYFNPEHVIAIATKDSSRYFEKAVEFAEKFNWKGRYTKQIISGENPSEIYEVTRRLLDTLDDYSRRFGIAEGRRDVVFDITGGRKIMSAALVFACEGFKNIFPDFNIKMFYIFSKNIRGLEISKPCSEKLIEIETPLIYYSDFLLERIRELLSNYNFTSVLDWIRDLKRELPEEYKGIYLFYENLTVAYQLALYQDNYKDAKNKLDTAIRIFKSRNLSSRVDQSFLDQIKRNLKAYRKIAEAQSEGNFAHPGILYLIVDLMLKGIRYEKLRDFSGAAILFYRCIELAQQYVFMKDYGVDTSNPDFKKLKKHKKDIDELYRAKTREILGKMLELPDKISLISGAIILKILNHNLLKDVDLKELKESITVRNQLPREHGLSPIKQQGLKKLKEISRKVIEKTFKIYSKEIGELEKIVGELLFPFENKTILEF